MHHFGDTVGHPNLVSPDFHENLYKINKKQLSPPLEMRPSGQEGNIWLRLVLVLALVLPMEMAMVLVLVLLITVTGMGTGPDAGT